MAEITQRHGDEAGQRHPLYDRVSLTVAELPQALKGEQF